MKLIDLLPVEYSENIDIQSIQQGFQTGINKLSYFVERFLENVFPNKAVEALELWENAFGLEKNYTLTDYERQSRIKSKIRAGGTCTVEIIENVIHSFENGEIEVKEIFANYEIQVKFISTLGRPSRLDEVDKAIAAILPAHLFHTFIFTYIAWEDIERYNHSWDEWDAKNLSWDAFEIYKE